MVGWETVELLNRKCGVGRKEKSAGEGGQVFNLARRAWIARAIMRVREESHNASRVLTRSSCVVAIVLSPVGPELGAK